MGDCFYFGKLTTVGGHERKELVANNNIMSSRRVTE